MTELERLRSEFELEKERNDCLFKKIVDIKRRMSNQETRMGQLKSAVNRKIEEIVNGNK